MSHDELIRKIYEFYQTDRDREACPVCGGCVDYHKRDCFYPDLQDALLEIAMGEGGNQT